MSLEALSTLGFIGWRTWDELRETSFAEVPRTGGASVVVRRAVADPTVPLQRLQAEWLSGAQLLYVGKADDLRRRLRRYADFGAGRPVGHWGGRFVWQLADSDELLVGWKGTTDDGTPLALETEILDRFARTSNGRLPFANLRR